MNENPVAVPGAASEDLQHFLDEYRWLEIVNTCNDLARHLTVDALLKGIVEAVRELGFERVRLYQHLRVNGVDYFVGRKSIGFDAARDAAFLAEYHVTRETYFATKYRINIDLDLPSRDTFDRKTPALCVWDIHDTLSRENPNVIPYPHRSDPFVLDSEEVYRWIEVPLLMPPEQPAGGTTGERVPVLWGKISADRGADSESLGVAELAVLALFASIVGGYLAVVEREQEEHRLLQLYRDFNERIPNLLRRTDRNQVNSVLQTELVNLFAELTQADVVYFRNFQGGLLVLNESAVRWNDAELQSRAAIPPVMSERDGYSGRLLGQEFLTPNGRWIVDQKIPKSAPFFSDDLRRLAPEGQGRSPKRTEKEQVLLSLGHALYIPVVVEGDRFRGVVIALARDDRLSARWNSVVPFVDSANLWYQLATNLVNRRWVENTLANVMPLVPQLAHAPIDSEQFHALLALLLTANQGLGWNRAFIWRAIGGRLELKYAVGGLADEEKRSAQQALMKYLEGSPLIDLFEDRLKNPAPARQSGGFDDLYELTVARPGARPIDAPYRDADGDETVPFVQWFLPAETSDRIYRLESHPWVEKMNRSYPGMFGKVRVFGFPFWCLHDEDQREEGLVLVDLYQYPELASEERLAATRLFLDTVAGLIHAQREQKAVRADAQHLFSLEHQRSMKKTWDQLKVQLAPFFNALPAENDAAVVHESELERLAESFRHTAQASITAGREGFLQPTFLKQVIDLRHHMYRQQRRANLLSQLGEADQIQDLEHFLRQIVQDFRRTNRASAEIEFKAKPGGPVNLRYPPLLLYQALEILIDNSLSHNPTTRPIRIEISLDWQIDQRGWCLVCIEYRDWGKGISPAARNMLFLNGFHESLNPGQPTEVLNRGRGLHLAMRSISHYGGEIRLEEQQPDLEERSRLGENWPAVFAIRFLDTRILV